DVLARHFLLRIAFEEGHEAVATGIGEGFEQHRVDHRKDGAVGSDPKREGRDNRAEERGSAQQTSISDQDVMPHGSSVARLTTARRLPVCPTLLPVCPTLPLV